MMNICILGGNGNIGFSLASILNNKYSVTCVNRQKSGPIPYNCKLIKQDRKENENFYNKLKDMNFEIVIDFTCMSKKDAELSLKTFKNIKHYIVCSSVAVYGRKKNNFPIDEQSEPEPENDYNPQYAKGKLDADIIFLDAYKSNKYPITILRPSITFSGRLGMIRQFGIDNTFLSRIKKNKDILNINNGSSFHQMNHSNEIAEIFLKIILKKECYGEIFNIAVSNPITWKEYNEKIIKIFNSKSNQVSVDYNKFKNYINTNKINISDIFYQNSYFCNKKIFNLLGKIKLMSYDERLNLYIKDLEKNNKLENLKFFNWESRLIKKI